MTNIYLSMLTLIFVFQGCSTKQTLNQSEQEKLDPLLQQLVMGEEVNKKKYSIFKQNDGTELYGVIIHSDQTDEMKNSGIQINTVSGNIITAKLSPQDIRKVANLNSVKYIENSKKDYPH